MTDSNDEYTKARDAAAEERFPELWMSYFLAKREGFKAGSEWGYERGKADHRDCMTAELLEQIVNGATISLSQQLEAAKAEIEKYKECEFRWEQDRREIERWKLECSSMGKVLSSGVVIPTKEYAETCALIAQMDEALVEHHKGWSHGNGDCSPECALLCKALAAHAEWSAK